MAIAPCKVGLVSRTFYYVPVWAALEQGFFEREGLAVELSLIGAAEQAQLFKSGALDIAGAPPEGVLQNAAAGGDLVVIAGNSGRLSHFLVTQPGIKSIAALRGSTIGILSFTEGSFFHLQILMAANAMRYPDDYKVMVTGGAPSRHQLLLEGKIDAGLQSIPWVYVAEEAGFNNLLDVADYIPDWQFNTWNASRGWAERNAAAAEGFLRAVQAGTDWMFAHRAEAARLAAREMEMPEAHALRGWDYFARTGAITRDLEVNGVGLARVIATQKGAGLVRAGAPDDPDRYVDRRFLAAAKR